MDRIIKALEVNQVHYKIINIEISVKYDYDNDPEYNSFGWWVDSHEIYDFNETDDVGDKVMSDDKLWQLDKVLEDIVDNYANGHDNSITLILEAIEVEPNVWYVKETLSVETTFNE